MVAVGGVYTVAGQGTAITPRDIEVTVVWVDEQCVWYRKEGSSVVHQTSLGRFESILILAHHARSF